MQLSDLDSQTVYESFASPDGTAGYRAENGETAGWLYFNPSGGSDDSTATVFLYWGAGVAPDPELDTPIGHVNVSALLSGESQPQAACRPAVTRSAILAGASHPEFLGRLLSAASDAQAEAVRDAAVKAGMLWRCACGWYNPEEAAHCQAGDPCRAPRPPRSTA